MPTPGRQAWSLRRLVGLWVLLTALALVAAFVLELSREAESQAWRRAVATAAAEAARISVVAERLVTVDPSVVAEVLVHAVLQDEVALALVVDPQGRVVVSTRAADRGRMLDEAHPALRDLGADLRAGDRVQLFEDRAAGLLRAVRPLEWPPGPEQLRAPARGVLWLELDVSQQVARQRDQVIGAQLAEALVLLLGGFLLLLGLSRLVLRPLARLRDAAERLGAGEPVALPPSRVRELDTLGRVLQRSAEALSESLGRLRDSEQRFRALAASAPDAIVTLDADGRVDQFNAAAERLFGWRADEIVGRTLDPLLAEGSGADHARHVQRFGNEVEGSSRRMQAGRLVLGRHRDGHTLHLEVGISRSRVDGVMQFTAMLRDVSDRVAIELELEAHRRGLEDLVRRRTAEVVQERDRAQAATRAKNEFLARIGHELRTPMNTVLAMAHLLRRQPAQAPDTRVVALDNAARQLHGLLEDILDFTRLEAGQLALTLAPTELRPLLATVVQSLAPARRRAEAELVLWVDADVPARLVIDGLRLRQVLGHLVDNALKFTPSGHVTLRVQRLASAGPGDRLRFEVSDTGIGLPPERLERLFEPFEQADGGDSRGFGGAGIGLVICQRVLALMGSRLQARSEVGRGSRIGFVLQAAQPDDATVGAPSAPPEGEMPRRALVVDALADARAAQAEALRTLGLYADTAPDAVSALRLLRAAAQRGEPFDQVLVGARQPGAVLGLPADAQAQALQPMPRWLLALPSLASPRLADVLRAGYAGLIDKPVLVEMLAERLRAAPAAAASDVPASDVPAPPLPQPPGPVSSVLPPSLQPLADLDALDLPRGLRSVRGSEVAYVSLLQGFAAFHRSDPAELRQAAQAGDPQALRALAHSLKSAAGSVGAVRVQVLAQALSQRPGPVDDEARALAAELAGALQTLIAALDARLHEAGPPAGAGPAGDAPAPTARVRRQQLREQLLRRDMAALRWLQTVGDDELAAMGVVPASLRHAVWAFDYDTALRQLSQADRETA